MLPDATAITNPGSGKMRIRSIFLAGIVVGTCITWSAAASAQHALIGVDGCAILATVVYAEVVQARLGYSPGSGANLLYTGRDELALCNQSARSVTRAFSAALRSTDIHVTWGFHTGYSGDYCLSHFLSRCYPRANPSMPPLSKSERSFVMHSWQAVHDSVQTHMAQYPGSDVVRFQARELGRSIRRSVLAAGTENQLPLYTR
jgi:hypothetical protein